MPIYNYFCKECKENFKTLQKNRENNKCKLCNSNNIELIPNQFGINNNFERQELTKRVQQGIDEAKQELRKDVLQKKANRTWSK